MVHARFHRSEVSPCRLGVFVECRIDVGDTAVVFQEVCSGVADVAWNDADPDWRGVEAFHRLTLATLVRNVERQRQNEAARLIAQTGMTIGLSPPAPLS